MLQGLLILVVIISTEIQSVWEMHREPEKGAEDVTISCRCDRIIRFWQHLTFLVRSQKPQLELGSSVKKDENICVTSH